MSFHANTAGRTMAESMPRGDAVRLLLDIVTGTRRVEPAPMDAAAGRAVEPRSHKAAPDPEPTPREIRALIRDGIIPAATLPAAPRCVVAEACPVAPASRATRCDARCEAANATAGASAVDAEWEPA